MQSLHFTCRAAAYGLPMVSTFSTILGALILFQLSIVLGPLVKDLRKNNENSGFVLSCIVQP
jgi:hypothetical protein